MVEDYKSCKVARPVVWKVIQRPFAIKSLTLWIVTIYTLYTIGAWIISNTQAFSLKTHTQTTIPATETNLKQPYPSHVHDQESSKYHKHHQQPLDTSETFEKDLELAFEWGDIIKSMPLVEEKTGLDDAWFGQQAAMFVHLRDLLHFKTKLLKQRTLNSKTFNLLTRDIKAAESRAYGFLNPKATNITIIDQLSETFETAQHRRGIVIVGGSGQYRAILHVITSLRFVVNCSLPIEIWYRGTDDITETEGTALRNIGPNISVKNLMSKNLWDEEQVGLATETYALKPFALLASSFAEPMLCDADVTFVEDPEKLYSTSAYKETGTFFFHDRRTGESNLHRFFDAQTKDSTAHTAMLNSSAWYKGQSGYEQESGLVLINKSRQDVLLTHLFTAWMNSKKPRGTLFEASFGDKESFWLAFELTLQPYYFNPSYGAPLGMIEDRNDGKQIIQADHILHYNTNKDPLWFNGGVLKHKHGDQKPWLQVEGFALDDGEWHYGEPRWEYRDGTIIRSMKLQETVIKTVELCKEMEERFADILGDRRGEH